MSDNPPNPLNEFSGPPDFATAKRPTIMVDGEEVPLDARFAAALPSVSEPPPPSYILRTLAWTQRMTPAELGGITLAASRGLEQGDPTLQVFLDDLGRATEVDLQEARLLAGLQAVAAIGLIAPDRVKALLLPAQPGEGPG